MKVAGNEIIMKPSAGLAAALAILGAGLISSANAGTIVLSGVWSPYPLTEPYAPAGYNDGASDGYPPAHIQVTAQFTAGYQFDVVADGPAGANGANAFWHGGEFPMFFAALARGFRGAPWDALTGGGPAAASGFASGSLQSGSDALLATNLGGANSGLSFATGNYATAVKPLAYPAPEASTWAMLAAGFAGLGLLAWRASRRASVQ